jgi:hypothetical protein
MTEYWAKLGTGKKKKKNEWQNLVDTSGAREIGFDGLTAFLVSIGDDFGATWVCNNTRRQHPKKNEHALFTHFSYIYCRRCVAEAQAERRARVRASARARVDAEANAPVDPARADEQDPEDGGESDSEDGELPEDAGDGDADDGDLPPPEDSNEQDEDDMALARFRRFGVYCLSRDVGLGEKQAVFTVAFINSCLHLDT